MVMAKGETEAVAGELTDSHGATLNQNWDMNPAPNKEFISLQPPPFPLPQTHSKTGGAY